MNYLINIISKDINFSIKKSSKLKNMIKYFSIVKMMKRLYSNKQMKKNNKK